jgi:hypothetical protein
LLVRVLPVVASSARVLPLPAAASRWAPGQRRGLRRKVQLREAPCRHRVV